jgi:hypothetical protein
MSPVFATNGGLSGAKRNTSTSAASGMWMLEEQNLAKRAGSWPLTIVTGTYSQSSLFSGVTAASSTIMTDGLFTNTGTATNSSANEWVKIDHGSSISIATVVIGTATSNIPGGWGRSYTSNRLVQYSNDDSTWTTLFTTPSFASDGIFTFTAPSSFTAVNARYLRIYGSSVYVAISEFYVTT